MKNAFGCFEGQEESMREKIFQNQMSAYRTSQMFLFRLLTLCSHQSGWLFSSLSFRDVEKLGSQMRKSAIIQQQSIKTEWKLAKIAFVVIIVFVLSWSPYACVTLIAWAG